MVKVKIENSYKDTVEFREGESLEVVKADYEKGLEATAYNLAKDDIEDGWQTYYKTYDDAVEVNYMVILDVLKDELSYAIVG